MNIGSSKNHARRGSLLQEAIIAIAISAAVLASVAQLLAVVAQQKKFSDERTRAVRAAGNLMEQVLSRSWDEISSGALRSSSLSDQLPEGLKGGQLELSVVDEPGRLPSKRVQIEIHWRQAANTRGAPVRLVAWRYRQREDSP